MKKSIKRILSLLMSCAMAASMLGTVAFAEESTDPSVDADGYKAEDVYVLNYSNQDIAGYEEWDAKLLYASNYRTNHSVTYPNGVVESWASPACVMNMINTTLINGRVADYPYASIGVYCVDGPTNAVSGSAYRRINLEDSTYFSDDIAGRLRAIVADAFPYEKDMSVLTNKVNAWITENDLEYTTIQNLNAAEVISAVQSVIWVLVNDGKFGSTIYHDDGKNYSADICVYPDTKLDATENTADNLESLVWYLMDLEPVAAPKALISNAAFKAWDVTYTQDNEGKYTATVTTTVEAEVDADDQLTLSAIAGDKMQTVMVEDGRNDYTFNFTGLDTQGVAKLAIDGTQSAEGVFLFDPVDGRYTSQSMIGCDDSTLPVHAEINVEPERSIIINKSTKVLQDGTTDKYNLLPLKNISFDIFKVCTLKEYLSGSATLSSVPTENEIEKYANSENNVATVTTDENGVAEFSLTLNNQPDGVYLIVERSNPAVQKPVDPFYVMVPTTNTSGEGWDYTIEVHPKNEVIGGPEIEKDVTSIGNDHDTYGVGVQHTWIIGADIPVDIANGTEYKISDTLDYRLDYVGNVAVKVEDAVNNTAEALSVALAPDEDYVLTTGESTQTVETKYYTVDTFTVSLTKAGMAKVAANIPEGASYANYKLRVYFDAKINANASFGVEIPNQAHLDYTNSVGFDYDADSDIPEVHTAGIKVIKKDGNTNAPLALAHFQLARKATEAEIADPDVNTSSLKISETEGIEVVYVEFYTDEAMTTKSDVVISDTNGLAYLYGIPYDTYYLVEIKAPEGYNVLPTPIEIEIGGPNKTDDNGEVIEVNHTNAYTEHEVLNFGGFELPETGGIGTTIYTAMGTLMICAAGAYIILSKKRAVC